MNMSNPQSSADFRILTRGDRRRIELSLMTIALSHVSMTKMSNRQLAQKLHVSTHAIRRHRQLMRALGMLAIIPGAEIPSLPCVPDTTWERLHKAMAEGWELLTCIGDELGEPLGCLFAGRSKSGRGPHDRGPIAADYRCASRRSR